MSKLRHRANDSYGTASPMPLAAALIGLFMSWKTTPAPASVPAANGGAAELYANPPQTVSLALPHNAKSRQVHKCALFGAHILLISAPLNSPFSQCQSIQSP